MGFVKIGFFRIVRDDEETYASYDELRSWDEDARKRFLDGVRRGEAQAYCACRADNVNPLTVTSLGHVRVAVNGRQGDHADSCPKSASYAGWAEQARKGLAPLEALEEDDGGRPCFNFSLPQLYPSKSSPSSSSGTGTGTPREKKIPLLDLVTCVNRIAWIKQTYSIKKKIAEAHREGRTPDWSYKNLEDFNRLFFGVCNDVYVRIRGSVEPLSRYAYRKKDFMASTGREDQFFVYAPILKVKEVNRGRKYQYVTLAMPGTISDRKATVRVVTDDFLQLFGEFSGGEEESFERGAKILAGFVRKTSFKKDDGGSDVWITLVKGCVINVTENGLFYENEEAGEVIRELCRRRVLFYRPYLPLENFGLEIPTVVIDRYKAKSLLIDCPDPSVAETHAGYARDNEEFEVIIAREGDNAASVVSKALPQRIRKERES